MIFIKNNKMDTSQFTHPYFITLKDWFSEYEPKLKMQNMGTYATRYFYKKDITKENETIVKKLVKKEGKINLTENEIKTLFNEKID